MAASAADRKTPQVLLVDWANAQDAWVRFVVGEALASRQQLPDAVLDAAYTHLLLEKQLQPGDPMQVPPLKPSDKNGDRIQRLEFVRLANLDGVNALCGGQEVTFSPRLTVLFGENAAGKSGYVRVLKRIAAVRSQEDVLPNLLGGGAAKPQRATISFKLDDKEDEFEWKGESGVAPFTRTNVFDSRAVAVHLDDDLSYTYTPRDLALFRITHDAIDSVKARLDARRRAVMPQGNPFISFFARSTSLYPKIETLGPQTDLGELQRLAQVTPEEAAHLPELRAKVDALKSQAADLRLEIAKGDLELFKRALGVSRLLEQFDWTAYATRVTAAAAARQNHEDATITAFSRLDIAGVLSPEWRAFIEAGETYLRSTATAEYPGDGDACVYCAQPLTAPSAALIRKYRDFTNNRLKQNLNETQSAVATLTDAIRRAPFDDVAAAVGRRVAAIAAPVPQVFGLTQRLLDMAAPVRHRLSSAEAVTGTEATAITNAARAATNALAASIAEGTGLVAALATEAGEREKLLRALSAELAQLESRLKLNELMPRIEEQVTGAKWAASAERVGAGFGGVLRSLTAVAKNASEELVNQDFGRLFLEECKALRAPHVKLEFPGREGQPQRRKRLVSKHALSEILSEGEQKVIALADFLAEAAMPQTAAPVIFDDPVNSLDYKRLQYVVDRLVGLSAERQVVVFTHNIWFTAELLNRFEKMPADCRYYEISNEDSVPGKVEPLQHPKWDTPAQIGKQIQARIQLAEKNTGVMREDLVRGAWSQVRSWCETFVEREVLADVTARYRPHVRMTSLPNIKTDFLNGTVSTVLPIFEKACRITEAHSQPLETLCVKPALEELKEDWATLQSERKKYVS